MSAQIDPAQAGNITKFKISSNLDENSIDLSTGVVDYRYYESVLSNNITNHGEYDPTTAKDCQAFVADVVKAYIKSLN